MTAKFSVKTISINDFEVWKPVIGYEDCYEVSSFGKVRSLRRFIRARRGVREIAGKLLLPSVNHSGYLVVNLYKDGKSKNERVHSLVAFHFLQKAKRRETIIDHLNHDRKDNKWTNLAWTTPKGNAESALNFGRLTGATNPRKAKKLTVPIVNEIRNYRKLGFTFSEVAKKFNISTSVACEICNFKSWKNA